MQRPASTIRLRLSVLLLTLGAAACGGGTEIAMPSADLLPAPTFAAVPADLADSVQLDAIDMRDTAGLGVDIDSVDAALLAPALAKYLELPGAQPHLTRLSIYDDSVYFGFYERGISGRSVTASYQLPWDGNPDSEPTLNVSEPSFDEAATFSIEGMDPSVPVRLVAALAERFPAAAVESISVDNTPSSGFGAVWDLRLYDARGELAQIYADFDGAIVAVTAN